MDRFLVLAYVGKVSGFLAWLNYLAKKYPNRTLGQITAEASLTGLIRR